MALRFLLVVFACFLSGSVCSASPNAETCAPNYAHDTRMQSLLHWDHTPLRIAFAPCPSQMHDQEEYIQAAQDGFAQWVDATHGLIRFQIVPDAAQADILVRFFCSPCIPGQGAAVGFTSMIFSQTVLRHSEMQLAIGSTTPSDLRTVAAHEFGHALGINGHSDDPSDLMFPVTTRMLAADGTPLDTPVHVVTLRDLNTLKLCYPGLLQPAIARGPAPRPINGHVGNALLRARRGFHP